MSSRWSTIQSPPGNTMGDEKGWLTSAGAVDLPASCQRKLSQFGEERRSEDECLAQPVALPCFSQPPPRRSALPLGQRMGKAGSSMAGREEGIAG